jgi:transposase
MARRKDNPYSEADIANALKVYLESGGNAAEAARSIGAVINTVQKWAARGKWHDILANQRKEVEAEIAAQALHQVVTIAELAVNIQYRMLAHMHAKIVEAQEQGIDPPYDPVRLVESMAKVRGQLGGGTEISETVVEDAVCATC